MAMRSTFWFSIALGHATLAIVEITFRALRASEVPLLHSWLAEPHVALWWEPATTLREVEGDYLPRLSGDDVLPLAAPAGVTQYLAYDDETPFAFIQAYRVMAHQDEGWWPEETDPCALGIDQFIGVPEKLGRGLGTALVRAFVTKLFDDDPRVTRVQADPSPDNARAIAMYRRAGFEDAGLVETPDGPVRLMRIVRPA